MLFVYHVLESCTPKSQSPNFSKSCVPSPGVPASHVPVSPSPTSPHPRVPHPRVPESSSPKSHAPVPLLVTANPFCFQKKVNFNCFFLRNKIECFSVTFDAQFLKYFVFICCYFICYSKPSQVSCRKKVVRVLFSRKPHKLYIKYKGYEIKNLIKWYSFLTTVFPRHQNLAK